MSLLRETIAALLKEKWRADMEEEINSINHILSCRLTLCKIDHHSKGDYQYGNGTPSCKYDSSSNSMKWVFISQYLKE